MRSGVFQKGRDPSCISTVWRRFRTSAPGPPPRVRVASGLAHPPMQAQAIKSAAHARFISHGPGRKDDDHTKKKTGHQDKDSGRRQVQLLRTPRAP